MFSSCMSSLKKGISRLRSRLPISLETGCKDKTLFLVIQSRWLTRRVGFFFFFLRKIMVVFGNETWVLEKRWPWLVYTPPSFLVDWRSPCWIIDDWTVQSNPVCDWASVESVWERSVWSDSLFDFLMKRVRVTEKLEVGYGA